MSNVTNIGQTAQCETMVATTKIVAPYLTVPGAITTGSGASPVAPTTSTTYVAGVNKYIIYHTLPAGVVSGQTLSYYSQLITGLPNNFIRSNNISVDTTFVCDAFGEFRVSAQPIYQEGVDALYAFISSSTAAVFTTPVYFKFVVTITPD
jgi:hypothetical protein